MESTSMNPLHFFDELIVPNGYNIWKHKTIKSIEDSVQGALESVNYELGKIEYTHAFFDRDKENVTTDIIKYNFSSDFNRKIDFEVAEVKNKIENITIDILKKGDDPNKFLVSQVEQIYYLIDKAKEDCQEFNLAPLNSLASFFIEKYSLKSLNRKKLLEHFINNSFFDIKQSVKPALITSIYDEAIILEILDDEVVDEPAFINVLTQHPSANDDVIIFKCDNQLAVHFINLIKPLFNNFTYSQISKSKKFFNKKTNPKVLNQRDLDSANTRLNKKTTHHKAEKISNALSRIISTD